MAVSLVKEVLGHREMAVVCALQTPPPQCGEASFRDTVLISELAQKIGDAFPRADRLQ